MPEDFPELADGDELEPWHLNLIYDELRRWRKLAGADGVTVNGAEIHAGDCQPLFIKLTGTYSSGYPWKQVLVGPGRAVQDTGVTGTGAYELRTGSTTLTADGTVYEARRALDATLLFDGTN